MRRLFSLATALSLLLSIAAAVAWATSYSSTGGWRMIASAHSADLTRASRERGSARFITTPRWSTFPNHGFWDAWWVRSHAGRLSLLTQVIDYEGILRSVHASPPSLVIDLPREAGSPAIALGRVPGTDGVATRLGFAFHSDKAAGGGDGTPATSRAWTVTLPYWTLVLLGFALPALWIRANRRRNTHLP